DDKAYWSSHGAIWVTDATPSGTHEVIRFSDGIPAWFPTAPIAHRGALLFSAKGSLYRSDGTAAGTTPIAALTIGERSEALGDDLLLACREEGGQSQLCATDGTAAGTRIIKDVAPAIIGKVGTRIVFAGRRPGASLGGLWATDGTADGTVELIAPTS